MFSSHGFFTSSWLHTHIWVFSVDFCVFTALSLPLKKLFTSIVTGNKLTRSCSPDWEAFSWILRTVPDKEASLRFGSLLISRDFQSCYFQVGIFWEHFWSFLYLKQTWKKKQIQTHVNSFFSLPLFKIDELFCRHDDLYWSDQLLNVVYKIHVTCKFITI